MVYEDFIWWDDRGKYTSPVASAIVYKEGDYAVAKVWNEQWGRWSRIAKSTDHASVIQSAIDEVYNRYGGGKVFISEGEYTINTEITPKSNIILTGDKPTLKHYSGNCIHGIDISNVVISNLKIVDAAPDQHTELGGLTNGILIESIDTPVENIMILNNEVAHSVREGIHLNNVLSKSSATDNYGLKNIIIAGNYIHDLTTGTIGTDGNGIGVHRKSDGVIIENNIIENTISTGILVGSGSEFNYNKNVYIGRNIIRNTKRYGIDLSGLYGAIIHSNYIYNDDSIIDENTYGILVESATTTKPSYHVNIVENVIDGAGPYAIYVYSNVNGVVVSHNKTMRVLNPTEIGARHIVAPGQNNIITHNEIDGSNDGSLVLGILAGDYSIIANNIIKNTTYNGIEVFSHCRVYGNYISGCQRYGIHIVDHSYSIIYGNFIDDVPADFYGIFEGGTSDYNIIENNDVSQITTGGKIKTVGANTIVRRNIGYLTENSGTATITAGNTSVTVNHGLASTPSKVLVTPLSDPGDRYYVTNITDTSFDIVIATAPSADVIFSWYAEV